MLHPAHIFTKMLKKWIWKKKPLKLTSEENVCSDKSNNKKKKKESVFINRRERNYRVLADKHIHGKKIL